MPWKEGVDAESVNKYRAFVKHARECDEAIDAGHMTPEEAAKSSAVALAEVAEKPKDKGKSHA